LGFALCAAEERAPIILWTCGSVELAGQLHCETYGEREKLIADLYGEDGPRISTAEDGLRQEFVAASRISARLGEVAAAQERAEDLQKQIAARKAEAGRNTEISAALAGIAHKIDEMNGAPAEEFGFLGLRLPDGEPVTLHKVAGALTGLLMIVDGAEAAPTADARAAAEKWESAGAEVLTRWKAVEADLAAVNAVLEKAKLQPLGK